MTVVQGIVTGTDGAPALGGRVTISLVDQAGELVIGFTGGGEVVASTSVHAAADGSWQVTLIPTGDITSPRGATLYRVDEVAALARPARYYISVPASGTHAAGDLRVALPGSAPTELAGYLPLTGGTLSGPLILDDGSPAASEEYVATHGGGGGGGTPSGTVVEETSYGQAAAAGTATAYARGDHTHGTPALPTAVDVGADAAGTASAAIGVHEAATDPHPGYLTGLEAAVAFTAADDPRLSDARTPLSHTHPATDITGLPAGDPYPLLEGYGLRAASGNPLTWMGNSSISASTLFLARVWIPAGVEISNLWAAVRTAAEHDGVTGPNQIGLWDGDGVLVGATADDPTLWTVAGWRGGPLAGGPVPASDEHRWVYIGVLARGTTGGAWPYPVQADDAHAAWACVPVGGGPKRGLYLAGQSALPGSFDPVSGGVSTTFIPMVGVS